MSQKSYNTQVSYWSRSCIAQDGEVGKGRLWGRRVEAGKEGDSQPTTRGYQGFIGRVREVSHVEMSYNIMMQCSTQNYSSFILYTTDGVNTVTGMKHVRFLFSLSLSDRSHQSSNQLSIMFLIQFLNIFFFFHA